jgi:hypothetical protein
MKSLQKALFLSLLACLLGGFISISAAQEPGAFIPIDTQIEVVAVGEPWVGPDTPWVFWNNNWYYNGILYAFYGPLGWWPYGYYANNLIVRNYAWYGPRWNRWYRARPVYWRNFHRHYGNGRHWHSSYRGHDAWRHHRRHGGHGRNLTRGGHGRPHDHGRNLRHSGHGARRDPRGHGTHIDHRRQGPRGSNLTRGSHGRGGGRSGRSGRSGR